VTAERATLEPGLEFDEPEHRYTFAGQHVRSVTQVLNILTGPIYDRIRPDVLDRAKLRGKNVHAWTELLDLGEAEAFGPAFRAFDGTLLHDEHEEFPYVVAWDKFRRESKFVPELVEQRFYHPLHRYAGTVDRIGILNGRRCTLEIKTVANLAPWVGLQTAAYHEAYNALHRGDLAGKARDRYAVQLRKDGSYRVECYSDNKGDFSAFLAHKTVWDWADAHRSTPATLDL
jgi:hypothetical protein